jgi:hypothetical protein
MANLSSAIMGNTAYAQMKTAPMIDITKGGQFGYMPDYSAFVSANPYVRKNLIARVMEAPRGFGDLADGQRYIDALRSIIELAPKTIEGLSSGLTVDFAESAFGGAGEMIYNVSNVTRAQSNPSFTWDERYGKVIQTFHTSWILQVMQDPETKYPWVITNGNGNVKDLLVDYMAMTVLFFEPDPTHTKIQDAWLCTGMMPKSDGTREGRKDGTGAGEMLELQIEYTATTQVGLGVIAMAQKILDTINLSGVNPNTRPAFVDSISADVAAGVNGYAEQVAAASRAAIRT